MNESRMEISYEQWKSQMDGNCILVDIRSEDAVAYGMLPGAIHIPEEEWETRINELPADRPVVLYCAKGIFSKERAESLREKGYEAYSFAGGYAGWLLESMKEQQPESTNHRAEEIEKSIRKKFHKQLFSKFAKAINEYKLVQENDKIAVCISGGKDSMLMAKLFQELKKHNKFPFELVFLVMDPGYSSANRMVIENNARLMNIPITVFESDIFDAVYDIEKSPCYLCARMRRGYLYSRAKELGCNKIALGHHYDDVIETILMGMLYGGQVQTMMPKLHSTNFEGMELIRPMYLIRERDIIHWADYNGLSFIRCACILTDRIAMMTGQEDLGSKRAEIKRLLYEMEQKDPVIVKNIFRSVENVNLSTVIAYKKDGIKHHFLDDYDKER